MEIALEKVIQLVVEEVVRELARQGVTVVQGGGNGVSSVASDVNYGIRTKTEKIDMSRYKTPLLTERMLDKLNSLTGEVIVPNGTVVTPKAKEILREKRISVRFE